MIKDEGKFSIATVVAFTKKTILELEEIKDYSNEKKKEILDIRVQSYISTLMNSLGVPFLIRWAVNKWIIPRVSILTQQIFDLLKAKIEGFTKG